MDILQKYDQESPRMSVPSLQWESLENHSFLVRAVIKLSRGKIQDEKHANIVLLILTCIIVIITLIILFGGGQAQPKAFTPKGYFGSIPGMPQTK